MHITVSQGRSRVDEHRIEHRLAGRARIAVALCLIGAAVGAYVGYHAVSPVYRSAARLRVKPVITADANDAFTREQTQRITHRRILEAAMYQSRFESDAYADFATRTNVRRDAETNLLTVSFDHADPFIAADVVDTIVALYMAEAPQVDTAAARRRIAELETDASRFADAHRALRDRIAETGGKAQLDALRQRHQYLLARLNNLEQDREQLRTVLIEAGAKAAEPLVPENVDDKRVAMTARRAELKAEIDSLVDRFGHEHRALLQRRAELANVEQWLSLHAETPAMDIPDAGHDLSTIRKRLAALDKLRDEVNADIEQIVKQTAAVARLDEAEHALATKLDRATIALQRFTQTAALAGEVTLASAADVPVVPHHDSRTATASLTAALGALVGFGLTLLLGPAPTPVRRAADLDDSLPLLGALPTLNDDLDDVDAAAAAALCVHNLRNRIQLGSQARTVAITSAAPGAGKTAVTTALGLSFAASGARTLLIDADFASHGLTQRAKAMGIDGQQIPHLATLDLAAAAGVDAACLSSAALRKLLDEAQQQYDVILIDAPPVSGHVESPVIASQADAVLAVVTRGEDRRQLRSTLAGLSRLGAHVAGLIFNQAPARDVQTLIAKREAA